MESPKKKVHGRCQEREGQPLAQQVISGMVCVGRRALDPLAPTTSTVQQHLCRWEWAGDALFDSANGVGAQTSLPFSDGHSGGCIGFRSSVSFYLCCH